ncbi:hypothetical protein ACU4GD_30860 [Cupriavidus basilensis]
MLTEVTVPGDGVRWICCGTFMLGLPGTMLLRNLPPVLRIATAERADCAWLDALIGMMRNEARGTRARRHGGHRTAFHHRLADLAAARPDCPGLGSRTACWR